MNLGLGFGIALALAAAALPASPAAFDVGDGDDAAPLASDDGRPGDAGAEEPAIRLEKTVVVTASRREQRLDQAPAATTVIGEEQIERMPAADLGDLLRGVPGLNVARTSAGEFLASGRQATGVLPRGEMVLVDNRPVYFDFTGAVLWSVLPVDLSEIRQVEVVRGPGSAVWGANAMDGVINIITRTPAEMAGTSLKLEGGERGTASASVAHAAVHGDLGYKASASWSQQDPYDRPTGTIPGSAGPTNPGGTPYPAYTNVGARQPRLDARLDYRSDPDTTWSVAGGFSGTGGLVLTPGGPYEHDGSRVGFVRADWNRRAARATLYANLARIDGEFLPTRTPSDFVADTFAADFTNVAVIGSRHTLSYGASARHHRFDLDLAPQAEDRNEFGAFVEDELRIGGRIRWFLGGRFDHIQPIGSVLSPRTSILLSLRPEHTLRLSYQRAFSAPTVVENFLDVTTPVAFTLPGPGGPLAIFAPFRSLGNPDLDEQRLDSFEAGWVGTLGSRAVATFSLYWSEIEDHIRLVPTSFYDSTNPPPGWPLPPGLLDVPFPDGFAGAFPASMAFANVGAIVNRGVEVSLGLRPADPWSIDLGYSWQDEPGVEDIAPSRLPSGEVRDSVNTPPAHRFTAGATYDRRRFYVSGSVSHQGEAFWTDVLSPMFWGPTEAFTQVDLGAGVRFAEERATLALHALNLLDEDIQGHVFGDIFRRRVTARMSLRF